MATPGWISDLAYLASAQNNASQLRRSKHARPASCTSVGARLYLALKPVPRLEVSIGQGWELDDDVEVGVGLDWTVGGREFMDEENSLNCGGSGFSICCSGGGREAKR